MIGDLVGKTTPFYGAINEMFRLGDVVYQAVEDENDGYRSMLEEIKIVTEFDEAAGELMKRATPIAYVVVEAVESRDDFEGYVLYDALIEHEWGRIGTNRHDDYYPSFCADFPALEPRDYPLRLNPEETISYDQYANSVLDMIEGKKPQPKSSKEEYLENAAFGSW